MNYTMQLCRRILIAAVLLFISAIGIHAQNDFWHIIPEIINFGPGKPGEVVRTMVEIRNVFPNQVLITGVYIVRDDHDNFRFVTEIPRSFVIKKDSSYFFEIETTLGDVGSDITAELRVEDVDNQGYHPLIQLVDTAKPVVDSLRVSIESINDRSRGIVRAVVTLGSNVPTAAARGEITYQFVDSDIAPIRSPLSSQTINNHRNARFAFTPIERTTNGTLTSEEFSIINTSMESTSVTISALTLFDNANNELQTTFVTEDVIVSVDEFPSQRRQIADQPLTLQLFPNPATSTVLVVYDAPDSPTNLDIYTPTGLLVSQITTLQPRTQSGTVTIPLDGLPSGTYFLRLTSCGSTTVRTVVKY